MRGFFHGAQLGVGDNESPSGEGGVDGERDLVQEPIQLLECPQDAQ